MIKIIGLILALGGSAFAGNWTAMQLGPFTYWSSPGCGSYTTQHLGNFDYTSGFDGYGGYHSFSGQRLGNFYFLNGN